MAGLRRRNAGVMGLTLAIAAAMTVLVINAPSIYRAFCAATGTGGTVRRASDAQAAKARAIADADALAADTVTVHFDANTDPDLPWAFAPEQSSVKVHLGQPVKIYYDAKNNSNQTIVGRAVYNIIPYKAAPYFFKIQCFCFTDERLGPGQSARMPVVLYVDSQLMKNKLTSDVHDITLSYTFYRQTGLSPDKIAAARDLAIGSKKEDVAIEHGAATGFANDAPRRP